MSPKNRKIIITLEKELLNAMKNSDVQKLDELIHDDLLFNIPNGQTITKSMDLDNYRQGVIRINKIASSEQIINLLGDNAIVSIIIDIKGTYSNQNIDQKYRVMRVWKKFNSSWKIIAGSSIQL